MLGQDMVVTASTGTTLDNAIYDDVTDTLTLTVNPKSGLLFLRDITALGLAKAA